MPGCELHYFSEALKMATAANVILPKPDLAGPYPVMFLLHGLSDDHTHWSRRTSIERYVEDMPLIVVMPNGGRGFYTDAAQGFAYELAMVELVRLVKAYFPTKPEWCVTGLSMGGYGALRLALRFPDIFRSAHSHSGALWFGHWPAREDDDWGREFARVVGPDPAGGKDDLYALVEKLDKKDLPAMRIDCGVDDFLLDANRAYHEHLTSLGVEHEYQEFPGAHTWEYWDEHVREALAFHAKNLGFGVAAK